MFNEKHHLNHRFTENKGTKKTSKFFISPLYSSFSFLYDFHCLDHCVGLYMTCEHWPWWVLSHTKGQRHHLQKEKDPPNTHSVVYLIPHQLLRCSCQLKSRPDFPLICLMNISADKQATWHSAPKQCVVRERSLVLATVMHVCMHMYIQLQCCCCYYSALNVLVTVYLHK